MARDGGRKLERRIAYNPLLSQAKFHDSKARFKGFSGPVGSGKSAALCHEALRLAHVNAGLTGLIGAPTYNMLRDATLDAFLRVCREHGLPYTLNKSTMTLTLEDPRTRVLFRSLDDSEKLRGSNLAWFGVDELTYCSEDAWLRLEARLREPRASRLCGFAVWTPKGFDWVYKRFRADPVPGYEVIEAQPFENRHLLRQTPDYYERLKVSYDEGFFRQEVLGEYLNLQSGQVYYAFDRRKNVGVFERDEAQPLLWSWDFNVNPMSSVIAQQVGREYRVMGEIFLRTSSTMEVCEEFVSRYGDHRGGVKIYGDSSGGHRHTVSGYSDYDLIRAFFDRRREMRAEVVRMRSNPPIRDRVNLVNAQLRNAEGERRLFIDKSCRELLKDLEQVVYKPDSGVIEKDRDPSRTHLSDALGYLLWQDSQGVRRIGERGARLLN